MPTPGEATGSLSWGESQIIESWDLSIPDLLVIELMIHDLFTSLTDK